MWWLFLRGVGGAGVWGGTPSISVNVWWHRHADALRRVPMWGAELERKGMIEQVVQGRRR